MLIQVRHKLELIHIPQISDVTVTQLESRNAACCPINENKNTMKLAGLKIHAEMMGLLSGIYVPKYVKNVLPPQGQETFTLGLLRLL